MSIMKELPELFWEKGRISAQEIGAWTSITAPQSSDICTAHKRWGVEMPDVSSAENYNNWVFYHRTLPCCHKVIMGGVMEQLARPKSIWSFACPVLHFVCDSSSVTIKDGAENAFVTSLGKCLSLQKLGWKESITTSKSDDKKAGTSSSC